MQKELKESAAQMNLYLPPVKAITPFLPNATAGTENIIQYYIITK